MKLFQAAWDGDVEGVIGLLETGVPVNITRPVSTVWCAYNIIYMHLFYMLALLL